MKTAVRQVAPVSWPSGDGWTIAILATTPEQFAHSFGLSFEPGIDGLGEYVLAALCDPAVGQVWLFRHRGAPLAGTEVLVDEAVGRDDGLSALRRLLGAHLGRLAWSSPRASPRG